MQTLPEIDRAFSEGRVSYSKVRAMTRVATSETESILLNIAIHGTAAHVERAVRGYRRIERIEEAQQAADRHHHLLHEGGFQIERTDDGVFRFLTPDGVPIMSTHDVERRFRGIAIEALIDARGIAIAPDTVRTRWQGERMDISIVMDAMLAARERAGA